MRHAPPTLAAALCTCLATLSCAEPPATPDTVVKEHHFELTLPGPWSRLSATETTFTYQHVELGERLTVSLMFAKRRLTAEEQTRAMEQFVEGTRAAEREGAELTGVGRGRMGDRLIARYEGAEAAAGRLFTCLIVSNASVVASFYFEAPDGDRERFLAHARAALTDITLHERPRE